MDVVTRLVTIAVLMAILVRLFEFEAVMGRTGPMGPPGPAGATGKAAPIDRAAEEREVIPP